MQKPEKTDAELAAPHFQHPQSQSSTPAHDQIDSVKPVGITTQVASDAQNKRVSIDTDVIGLFETLTAAPTGSPINTWQQIKIAKIAGTWYLYVFDAVGQVWKRVALS